MARVAVLGTGIMGRAMAANLAAAGHDTIVWNRTRDRAEGIAGTTVADTPEGAVAGRDAVVTMLVDADTVLDVMTDEVLRTMGDAVWCQMSTVGDEVRRLADAAAQHGVAFVDAPVAGTKQPAIDGTLRVLAAGPAAARDVADQVFDAVGASTVWLGEQPGTASRMKLLVNGMLVHHVAAIAEGLRAAAALGVEPQQLLDTLEGTVLGSGVISHKGAMMVTEDFDAEFPVEHAGKDARLLVEAAGSEGQRLPVTAAIAQLHHDAVGAGHAGKDMAAVVLGLDA